MKNNKARGESHILLEMLKKLDLRIREELRELFNRCVINGATSKGWKNAIVSLVYKKVNPAIGAVK